MRALTAIERERAAALASVPGASVGLFEVTSTQISKSIIDANASIRRALQTAGIHDYAYQPKGEDHKHVRTIFRMERGLPVETRASFYRPQTKDGDPRFWPYGSNGYLLPGDIGALVCVDGVIYLVQLGDLYFDDVAGLLAEEYLAEPDPSPIAQELLWRLRQLASQGPIPSPRRGDTAIGAAVEQALGIAQNSSREPDYKGIEIKAKRAAAQVRSTLFACVPDWRRSARKSSRDILERHGYDRDGVFKLYCQVNAGKPNSLGLRLVVDHEAGDLHEVHQGPVGTTPVATWGLGQLIDRLSRKHAETFWVTASRVRIDDDEHFQLESVEHTRRPHGPALPYLIDDDIVTMDHLIKRSADGRVSEKGPLFKMERRHLHRLFPEVVSYALR